MCQYNIHCWVGSKWQVCLVWEALYIMTPQRLECWLTAWYLISHSDLSDRTPVSDFTTECRQNEATIVQLAIQTCDMQGQEKGWTLQFLPCLAYTGIFHLVQWLYRKCIQVRRPKCFFETLRTKIFSFTPQEVQSVFCLISLSRLASLWISKLVVGKSHIFVSFLL